MKDFYEILHSIKRFKQFRNFLINDFYFISFFIYLFIYLFYKRYFKKYLLKFIV